MPCAATSGITGPIIAAFDYFPVNARLSGVWVWMAGASRASRASRESCGGLYSVAEEDDERRCEGGEAGDDSSQKVHVLQTWRECAVSVAWVNTLVATAVGVAYVLGVAVVP